MNSSIEFSVIVESYTLSEGGDWSRFRQSLRAATAMVPEDGRAEVLVPGVCGSPELEKMLAEEFPGVRRVEAIGLGYDAAKKMTAELSAGRYVLFLDGDCIPGPRWHHHLLEILRSGKAVACGGFSRYEGGFMARIMSVMDFGFFFPTVQRDLKCYASNNCGFLRETLIDVPIPDVDLRCSSYYHAQLLWRRGTRIQLVPEASVLHEMQPFIRERSRRGYDVIAACWVDPQLPESRWLRAGVFSVPLFYAEMVLLDWRRICIGRKDLDLTVWQVFLALPLFPISRLIDAAGMVRAFARGRVRGGWGGWFLRR